MSLLEKVCKELGVEVGEEWLGSDGKNYMIENGRILEYYEPENYSNTDYESWVVSGYEVYADILQEKLKPAWRPKEGDIYYTPSIKVNKDYRFCKNTWLNDDIDQWYLSNNMVLKTKEEAIAAANKMIEFIKGES